MKLIINEIKNVSGSEHGFTITYADNSGNIESAYCLCGKQFKNEKEIQDHHRTIMQKINVEVEVNKCPNCNYEEVDFVKYDYVNNIGSIFHIYCQNCRMHGPYGINKDEAISNWNRMTKKGL